MLVTGAARRVGLAIAVEMARIGWDVALHHHRSAPDDALATVRALDAQARAHRPGAPTVGQPLGPRRDPSMAIGAASDVGVDVGVDVRSFAADLADEAACNALVPRVVAEFGRLDAVVNNASLFHHDDVATFGYAAMDAHWRANTAPAIVLARALHAHLAGRGARGCVVNLVDQKLWNPNPDHLSYTLSKAALEAATHLLARALAPVLRVVGVAPGVTLPTAGTMSDAQFQAAHAKTALGRSSSADDIARAVRFLIESPAITGHTLLVDGGQHLSPQPRDVAFLVATTP